jgi:hypothetical protein
MRVENFIDILPVALYYKKTKNMLAYSCVLGLQNEELQRKPGP